MHRKAVGLHRSDAVTSSAGAISTMPASSGRQADIDAGQSCAVTPRLLPSIPLDSDPLQALGQSDVFSDALRGRHNSMRMRAWNLLPPPASDANGHQRW